MGGIEPPCTVYETVALPLSYTGFSNQQAYVNIFSTILKDDRRKIVVEIEKNKTSPHRMIKMIEGGARVIEFQIFLGQQGAQLYRTTAVWKNKIFFTLHEKILGPVIDATGGYYYID